MKVILMFLFLLGKISLVQDTLFFTDLEFTNFDFYGGVFQVKYKNKPINGVVIDDIEYPNKMTCYYPYKNGRVEGEAIGIIDSLSNNSYRCKFKQGVKITEFESVNFDENIASIKFYSDGFLDSLHWVLKDEIIAKNFYTYFINHKQQVCKRYTFIDNKLNLYNETKGSIKADSIYFYQYRYYVYSGLTKNYHIETYKISSKEFYKNNGGSFSLEWIKEYDLDGKELIKDNYDFYVKGNLIDGEFYDANNNKALTIRNLGLENVWIDIQENAISFKLLKMRSVKTVSGGGFDFKLEAYKSYIISIAKKGYQGHLIYAKFETQPKEGQNIEIIIPLQKKKWYQSNKIQMWELSYSESDGFVYKKQN